MSMPALKVSDLLEDRILVSRESARLLETALCATLDEANKSDRTINSIAVAIDFEGIEGIAPSFLDELLLVFENLVGAHGAGRAPSLVVLNPPTRLSLKFEAVARGHRMVVKAQSDGSWMLTDCKQQT